MRTVENIGAAVYALRQDRDHDDTDAFEVRNDAGHVRRIPVPQGPDLAYVVDLPAAGGGHAIMSRWTEPRPGEPRFIAPVSGVWSSLEALVMLGHPADQMDVERFRLVRLDGGPTSLVRLFALAVSDPALLADLGEYAPEVAEIRAYGARWPDGSVAMSIVGKPDAVNHPVTTAQFPALADAVAVVGCWYDHRLRAWDLVPNGVGMRVGQRLVPMSRADLPPG